MWSFVLYSCNCPGPPLHTPFASLPSAYNITTSKLWSPPPFLSSLGCVPSRFSVFRHPANQFSWSVVFPFFLSEIIRFSGVRPVVPPFLRAGTHIRFASFSHCCHTTPPARAPPPLLLTVFSRFSCSPLAHLRAAS